MQQLKRRRAELDAELDAIDATASAAPRRPATSLPARPDEVLTEPEGPPSPAVQAASSNAALAAAADTEASTEHAASAAPVSTAASAAPAASLPEYGHSMVEIEAAVAAKPGRKSLPRELRNLAMPDKDWNVAMPFYTTDAKTRDQFASNASTQAAAAAAREHHQQRVLKAVEAESESGGEAGAGEEGGDEHEVAPPAPL